MGRLIDADKAIEDMQYYHDDCAKTSEYTRLGFETAIEVVKDAPTVEAIPKAQYDELKANITMMRLDYEARLKADLVAMLTEIQLEIEERRIDGSFYGEAILDCAELIQQKINALKGDV